MYVMVVCYSMKGRTLCMYVMVVCYNMKGRTVYVCYCCVL